MTTFVQTDYRDQGAGKLLAYIGREGDTPVYDRAGRPLSSAQKARFIAASDRHQFNRHLIISPENGSELSNDELGRETRRTLEEFTKGRPSATYAYTVHRDTEHPHAHIALTGEKTDLYMDRKAIERVREQANERMVERYRYRHRSHEQDRQHVRERPHYEPDPAEEYRR